MSALFSGSEVAFFSLSVNQLHELREDDDTSGTRVIQLLENPNRNLASKQLLATILIANNFVNVAIVLLSTLVTNQLISDSLDPILRNVIQIGVVTFVIVLFGEVIPKVYATGNNVKMAKLVSSPIHFLKKIFNPLSSILIKSTSFLDKRFSKHEENNLSAEELEHAINLTHKQSDEKKIYHGIVNFGNLEAKQVMTARIDVFAFESNVSYQEVLAQIIESKYSRIPIYEENLDKVIGILFIKDLIPHLTKKDFDWQQLIKTPVFTPEVKKLDDLMQEFQHQKKHMAIVVDEYGGTSGIITLEDILEEIVGEITDEFDQEELNYSKLDDNTYVFEGKTSLPDLYRVIGEDIKEIDIERGDSSTLGGLVIELFGKIPMKGERINLGRFTFVIDAADKRKIKRIKLIIHPAENED